MIFPKASIPIKAVLSLQNFGSGRTSIPSFQEAGACRFVTSGRSAIALGLEAMGVGRGDQILIPAFHCTSMVEPALWREAEPVFYQITAETQINFDDIARKLTPRTRALMITHYFGFPQSSAKVRAFCDQHGIALIEDCAHAFFGIQDGRPLGGYGDFSIASSMKFFPIYDGGVLASSTLNMLDIKITSAGVMFDAKAIVNGIEQAIEYGRLSVLRPLIKWPLALKDALWRQLKKGRTTNSSENIGPAAADGGYGFDVAWIHRRQSLLSRWIMRRTDARRLVERRRDNYLRLQSALANVRGGKPLFASLPEHVVPYVFPWVLEQPERVFGPLKMAGVPILRFGEFLWPGVDERTCPVSADYSRRVFQFPCHQELTEQEVDWMVDRIKGVLSEIDGENVNPHDH